MNEIVNEKQTTAQILEYAKENQWEKILLPTETGIPVLDKAVELQKLNLVEPIIAGDYDLALRRAVYYKNKSIILPLLPHVKNIHAPSKGLDGQCALHFAAMNGMDDVVKLLIEYGTYPNIVDKKGNTPLHLACKNNHASTAIRLLEMGAFPSNPNLAKEVPQVLFTDNNEKNECNDCFLLAERRLSEKNLLPSLSDSELNWMMDSSQVKIMEFKKENRLADIIKQMIARKKIKCLSGIDLIQIEKSHKILLCYPITMILNAGEGYRYINLTPTNLEVYNNLSEKILKLEENLGCQFEVVFNNKPVDSSIGNYFLKSKTSVTSEICEKLDKEFYNLSIDSELLIYGDNLDRCIADAERRNKLNHLKLLTDKIGFNAKWNSDKNDSAWCYVPDNKVVILKQYNLLPIELRKTKDEKHILLLKELSKQDLPALIPTLIQIVQQSTSASSQTNGFGMFDHSQSERASVLPKRKKFNITITDEHGEVYKDCQFDPEKATPAQYFAAWAYMAVDLLNGGHGLSEHVPETEPESALLMSLTIVGIDFSKHPYFLTMKNESDPNHGCYLELMQLIQSDQFTSQMLKSIQKQEELAKRIAALLVAFKVPGIKVKIDCVEADMTEKSDHSNIKYRII